MSTYGIKIVDVGGDALLLTPDMITIISAGRSAMPAGLNGDNTYGLNIDLPGTAAIAETSLGVIALSFIMNINLLLNVTTSIGVYSTSWCMNSSYTFYTRNEATGVLSTWTPGTGDATNYDACLAAYPIAFWDKRGAITFTSINIFAATCYEVYDQSASAYIKVYSIASQGVENVDYAIYLKKYPTV